MAISFAAYWLGANRVSRGSLIRCQTSGTFLRLPLKFVSLDRLGTQGPTETAFHENQQQRMVK
jgi:hypothetical protein